LHSATQNSFLGDHFAAATSVLQLAKSALTDAADFVRTQASAPLNVGITRASDDPHIILRFGQLQARLHAAEGLLARATRLLNATAIDTSDRPPSPNIPSSPDLASSPDAATFVAIIEARAFASDLAAEISAQLVAWGGPSPTGNERHDSTGQPIHTANHWNYHHAGNYYLKGIEPPNSGRTGRTGRTGGTGGTSEPRL
jgi:alkylation response protein AidB-like acyl-CoA dehydrogenase